MQRILYISSATKPFGKAELVDLLTKSRERNARLGITGMLLYKDGNFIQVLEGAVETVDEAFSRINADPRHNGVIVLLREKITAREYPDWSMGFREVQDEDLRATPGFNEFLNLPRGESLTLSRSEKLLRAFRANM